MIVSTNNSTTNPLQAGGIFTGKLENIIMYEFAQVSVITDTKSTVKIQFMSSPTADADDAAEMLYDILPGKYLSVTIDIKDRFCRVICENTSDAAQTYLNLRTVYNDGAYDHTLIYGMNKSTKGAVPLKVTDQGAVVTNDDYAVGPTLIPVVCIDFKYSRINSRSVRAVVNGTGASVAAGGLFMTVRSGSNSNGYAVCESTRQIFCRSGADIICKFTTVYGSGVAASEMYAGMGNSTTGLYIGYNETQFGVMRRFAGNTEIQRLTIVTGSVSDETATLTLDGVLYTVAIPAGSSPAQICTILANGKYTGVETCSVGNTIHFSYIYHGEHTGTFTYKSLASTGNFTRIQEGQSSREIWQYREAFSDDTLDGSDNNKNPSGWLLDPKNLNAFLIEYQWLEGNALFKISDPQTGQYLPFHRIKYAGKFNVPSLNTPYLKLQWVAKNKGNTNTRILKGSAGYLGLKGECGRYPSQIFCKSNFLQSNGTGSTLANLLTIKCRRIFSDAKLHGELYLTQLCLNGSNLGSRQVSLSLIIGAEVTQPVPEYTAVNADSIALFDTTGGVISGGIGGGIEILTLPVSSSTNVIDLQPYDIVIGTGERVTLAVKITGGGGSSSNIFGSISWMEYY